MIISDYYFYHFTPPYPVPALNNFWSPMSSGPEVVRSYEIKVFSSRHFLGFPFGKSLRRNFTYKRTGNLLIIKSDKKGYPNGFI
jgi:hypothetical protein